MKLLIPGFLFLLVSCGQTSTSEKDKKASSADTNQAKIPVVVKPDTAKAPVTSMLSAVVNDSIARHFKKKQHVLTDQEAHWIKGQFDYFIAPKRDSLPDYPYITSGDFNGDGQQDLAAVVTGEVKNAYTIVIFITGKQAQTWEEDVLENAAISTQPKTILRELNEDGNPGKKIKMKGDGILVEYFEQGSFVIYWNGNKFERVQQGD